MILKIGIVKKAAMLWLYVSFQGTTAKHAHDK